MMMRLPSSSCYKREIIELATSRFIENETKYHTAGRYTSQDSNTKLLTNFTEIEYGNFRDELCKLKMCIGRRVNQASRPDTQRDA